MKVRPAASEGVIYGCSVADLATAPGLSLTFGETGFHRAEKAERDPAARLLRRRVGLVRATDPPAARGPVASRSRTPKASPEVRESSTVVARSASASGLRGAAGPPGGR